MHADTTLEIALSADGEFTWLIYGTLTVCRLTSRINDADDVSLISARHDDPMMARLVFDWATRIA